MRRPLLHTKVTVKLRKSIFREEWYLYIESYPVRNPGSTKPKRVIEAVNRTITTPIWDMTAISKIDEDGNYKYKPKRDSNGIIQCSSQLDKEACRYADKVRALRQQEYDTAVVFSDREQEMIAQNEHSEQDFIAYFNSIIYKCHPKSSDAIIVNWARVGKLLSIYSFIAHCDEKNCHIHATITPILEDGRLSAKDMFGGGSLVAARDKMREWHDWYAAVNEKWGLERGDDIHETGARHKSLEEHNRELHRENKSLEEELETKRRAVKGLTTMIENLTRQQEKSNHRLRNLKHNSRNPTPTRKTSCVRKSSSIKH